MRLLGHGQDYSRAQVVAGLNNGDTYFTYTTPPAAIYVHECPHCDAGDYITTHPDSTPTNDLLSLPRY